MRPSRVKECKYSDGLMSKTKDLLAKVSYSRAWVYSNALSANRFMVEPIRFQDFQYNILSVI